MLISLTEHHKKAAEKIAFMQISSNYLTHFPPFIYLIFSQTKRATEYKDRGLIIRYHGFAQLKVRHHHSTKPKHMNSDTYLFSHVTDKSNPNLDS